jgi:hypothetical protein
MKIKLSKIQVAEIQLNEAIYLYFSNAHPIVVETLIGAVAGILRPLGRKYGIKAPIHDSDIIKPEYKKEWIGKYLHKAQNFCKHSANDSNDILEYEAKVLPFSIYEACYLYRWVASNKGLKYRQSSSGLLFEMWFQLHYPELVKDHEKMEQLFIITGINIKRYLNDISMVQEVAEKYRIKYNSA